MAEVKHEVTYLSDVDGILTVPSTPTKGNLPVFGDKTDLGASVSDSGKSISDFVTQDNIDDAVKSASADILAEISGAYAIKAYSADQWSANTNYPAGSFCQHDGVGYRCKEEHESGTEFDASKWEVVLTSDGKSAIDAMLFGYSKDGLVGMNDVAASFDSDAQYVAGQLVAKDGTLQVCTKPGRGGAGAEFDSGAAVEKAISARVSGLVQSGDILEEFSKDADYSRGDACSYNGKFYVAKNDIAAGHDWNANDWNQTPYADIIHTSGDTSASCSFEVVTVSKYVLGGSSSIRATLSDRSVNVVKITIPSGKRIILDLPSQIEAQARDLYVVFDISVEVASGSSAEWSKVEVQFSNGSIRDCLGQPVSVYAEAGEVTSFRLSDVGSYMVISGYGDYAYNSIALIDKALDDILASYGEVGTSELGMYLKDDNGAYHQVKLVTDPENGEVSIGVEQEGV